MKHPHRLILLCGGWLVAAMAAAVLAHAHPESACGIISKIGAANSPRVGAAPAQKASPPVDSVTPTCLTPQYALLLELVEHQGGAAQPLCSMDLLTGPYKKLWMCTYYLPWSKVLSDPNGCAPGFTPTQALGGSAVYLCAGTDTSATFTCIEGYVPGSIEKVKILANKYNDYTDSVEAYKCQRQSTGCGPSGVALGGCCVAY